MTNPYTPYYYRAPDSLPTPFNIPRTFRQNETPTWQDDQYYDGNGVAYSSSVYTLTYVLAGPSADPVKLTAAANGSGWQTTVDVTSAANLVPGQYRWQAHLTKTGFRLIANEGELVIERDLNSVTGVYDGRTLAEQALAACETALATFNSTNGMVRRYQIGDRMMEFQDVRQIIELMSVWRARVASEIDAQHGGKSRHLLVRWSRGH